MEHSSDGLFPLLNRAYKHAPSDIIGFTNTLKMEDMGQLAVEATTIFERVCLAESSVVSHEHLAQAATMSNLLVGVNETLQNREDEHSGQLLRLLLQGLLSSSHLHCLLKMCDANFCTGCLRCNAMHLLRVLSTLEDIFIPYSSQAITVFCKSLEDNSHFSRDIHRPGCMCDLICQQNFTTALGALYDNHRPEEIIARTYEWDWTAILDNPMSFTASELRILRVIHEMAITVLKTNRQHENARLLLSKIGSAQVLLQRILQRTVDGYYWGNVKPNETFEELVFGLNSFFNCLVPTATSAEIDSLASKAKDSIVTRAIELGYSFFDIMGLSVKPNNVPKPIQELVHSMMEPRWTAMKTETFEERWSRLSGSTVFQHECITDLCKKVKKRLRLEKKSNTGKKSLSCANCFASEQVKKLFVCALCKRMHYCSKKCQTEHWKKSHKKHCARIG